MKFELTTLFKYINFDKENKSKEVELFILF